MTMMATAATSVMASSWRTAWHQTKSAKLVSDVTSSLDFISFSKFLPDDRVGSNFDKFLSILAGQIHGFASSG
jgi:hypothetical protein